MRRSPSIPGLVAAALLFCPLVSSAQESESVRDARVAFDELDYGRAVELAEAALTEPLSESDRIQAFEVLGYAYGILDQADRAVETLSQMIVLDPDREPDRQALPPRIAGLYDQAFDQVLVVRRILVDSVAFVSGEGSVTMHYEVSRPATASLRLIGQGLDAVIDSSLVNPGPARFDWNAQLDGRPIPAGEYQLLVTASQGRNQYQRLASFDVRHSAVDTTAHVSSIQGFAKVPETEVPPRDWRPLGVSTLLTGAVAGAALALNNSSFEGARVELGIAAVVGIGTGLVLSLRQPEPRPVPTAIQLNQLIDQSIADRNAQIAAANEERRRRVRLTIVQVVQ
jgi:hypothetical protein